MTIQIYLFLALAQTVLSATVAFLSFLRFKSRNEIVRLIGFVFLTSCIANVMAAVLVSSETFKGYINIPYPVYAIISLCLYSRLYYVLLHKKKAGAFIFVAGAPAQNTN